MNENAPARKLSGEDEEIVEMFSCRLPTQLKTDLKVWCARKGVPVQDVVARALRQLLEAEAL